jgi:hypothetical protein
MIISDRPRRWFPRYNFRFGGSLSIAKIVWQATGRRDCTHGHDRCARRTSLWLQSGVQERIALTCAVGAMV